MPRFYKVSKNVFVLLPRWSTFSNGNVNIIRAKKTALIDTGSVSEPGTKYLLKMLKSIGINTIDYIIITHSHVDHCQNAGFLAEKFGAEVFAHKNAKAILNRLGNISTEAFEYWELLEETYPRLLHSRYRWLIQRLIVMGYNYLVYGRGKNIEVINQVKEGDMIELGDYSLEVLFTPGHSHDSICLLEENQKILFTGDMIPWTPYIHTNIEEFRYSITKILNCLDQNKIKISVRGHQKPVNAVIERANYKRFLEDIALAEKRIIRLLDRFEVLTAQEMLPYVFHRTHFIHQLIYRILMRTQLFWIKKYLHNLEEKQLIQSYKRDKKTFYRLVKEK